METLPSLLRGSRFPDETGLAEDCGCDYSSHFDNPRDHDLCMLVYHDDRENGNLACGNHLVHGRGNPGQVLGPGNSCVCCLLSCEESVYVLFQCKIKLVTVQCHLENLVLLLRCLKLRHNYRAGRSLYRQLRESRADRHTYDHPGHRENSKIDGSTQRVDRLSKDMPWFVGIKESEV